MSASLQSSLGRYQPRTPLTQEELAELKLRAWVECGILLLRIEDGIDTWERQMLRNIAKREFGGKA